MRFAGPLHQNIRLALIQTWQAGASSSFSRKTFPHSHPRRAGLPDAPVVTWNILPSVKHTSKYIVHVELGYANLDVHTSTK